MIQIIIDTIDWASLAKTYNEKHSKDISFEGSTAYIYYITEEEFSLHFHLIATDSSGKQTIVDSNSLITRDKNTGKLCSVYEKSSELPPPNSDSVTMGKRYILYNILSKYVEPYLRTHSVPLQVSCPSSDPSAIPLSRMTFTTPS
jgi:hypothetical protein